MDPMEMIALLESVDVEEVCDQSFKPHSDYAEDLNRQQLNEGMLSNGGFLPEYRRSTKERKAEEGKQTDPMNLKDEGDFQGSITTDTVKGQTYFVATDYKASMLAKTYSPAILGLSTKYKIIIKPVLQEAAHEYLQSNYGFQ